MGPALEDATNRLLVLLVSVLGATATVVLSAASPGPAVAGLSVFALALAALLALAIQRVLVSSCLRPVVTTAVSGPPPLLSGGVTDPVHHPVCPRAPGPA